MLATSENPITNGTDEGREGDREKARLYVLRLSGEQYGLHLMPGNREETSNAKN